MRFEFKEGEVVARIIGVSGFLLDVEFIPTGFLGVIVFAEVSSNFSRDDFQETCIMSSAVDYAKPGVGLFALVDEGTAPVRVTGVSEL
ncbi:MAG: hypothetical protein WAS54_10835 [Scrofimicrobium sp.]